MNSPKYKVLTHFYHSLSEMYVIMDVFKNEDSEHIYHVYNQSNRQFCYMSESEIDEFTIMIKVS